MSCAVYWLWSCENVNLNACLMVSDDCLGSSFLEMACLRHGGAKALILCHLLATIEKLKGNCNEGVRNCTNGPWMSSNPAQCSRHLDLAIYLKRSSLLFLLNSEASFDLIWWMVFPADDSDKRGFEFFAPRWLDEFFLCSARIFVLTVLSSILKRKEKGVK